MLAFWMFRLIKHNKFFLYYAEGKDNHGVVEDHDAEVDTLCYKEIFKQRFHSQITFHNSFYEGWSLQIFNLGVWYFGQTFLCSGGSRR